MTKKKTPAAKTPTEAQPEPNLAETRVEETPFEAAASICTVLVVGLFILTFLAQNFVIPSGSMENTLLVGDHLVVDRITLAPEAKWMPLVRYREPRRGDVVVFIKPVPDEVDGKPQYLFLVKRLIGVPGDHIHLRDGVVFINGVAQTQPKDGKDIPANAGESVASLKMPLMKRGRGAVETIARANIHHSRQEPARMLTRDRHPRLLSNRYPRCARCGHLNENGRIEKQDHRPAPVFQAFFEPPFA